MAIPPLPERAEHAIGPEGLPLRQSRCELGSATATGRGWGVEKAVRGLVGGEQGLDLAPDGAPPSGRTPGRGRRGAPRSARSRAAANSSLMRGHRSGGRSLTVESI